MNFIDLFPTTIFLKQLKFFNLSLFKDYILNSEIDKGGNNGSMTLEFNILNNSLFTNLKKDILDNSKTYLKELGHIFSDLQISDSWGNLHNINEGIHNHCHTNSYISGCFYVTDGSPIEFQNPLLEIKGMKSEVNKSKNYRTWDSYTLDPQAGLLVIFPSWLNHRVLPSKQKERISIAFNILPKGMFGPLAGRINL
jgi:uncharacterized protein (TIGR02466 family)